MNPERNIRLVIAYDGTAYLGWQRQKEHPTVQGTIEDVLSRLTQQNITLNGAGRTDAGVHAWGQVASFKTRSDLPAAKLEGALNALLPRDILIRHVQEAPPTFHARYSSQAKIYDYMIHSQRHPSPFLRHYAWAIREPVDLELIKEGLLILKGEQDFSSFQTQGSEVSSPVRILYQARVLPIPWAGFRLRFKANGFLRHMVRNMVGILLRLGLKRITLEDLQAAIQAKDRSKTGEMAPPHGLFLRKVIYPPSSFDL
jgi:tRNA pseudouridine38-40 synthase